MVLKDISSDLKIWSSGDEWKGVRLTVLQFPDALVETQVFSNVLGQVLGFLDDSPIVRKYSLGTIFAQAATAPQTALATRAALPVPQDGITYPVIGVVDGGVSRHSALTPWRVGGLEFMRQPDGDREHGTFIAGLIVGGGRPQSWPAS